MMTIELLRELFGWCAVINVALMLWWFLFVTLAPDFIFRIHSKMFHVSKDQLAVIHYVGILIYKLIVLVFILIPYIALVIIS